MDEQELADELAELEQDELNKRLAGAESAPLHLPSVPNGKVLTFHSTSRASLMSFVHFSSNTSTSYRRRRGGSRIKRTTSSISNVISSKVSQFHYITIVVHLSTSFSCYRITLFFISPLIIKSYRSFIFSFYLYICAMTLFLFLDLLSLFIERIVILYAS